MTNKRQPDKRERQPSRAFRKLLAWLKGLTDEERRVMRETPDFDPKTRALIHAKLEGRIPHCHFVALPNPDTKGRCLGKNEEALLDKVRYEERLQYYSIRDRVIGLGLWDQ